MEPSPGAIRIRRTLFVCQSIFSAGYLAAVTLASIVGADLAEHEAWAGVPAAGLLFGAAGSASLWGAGMDRFGRRPTLVSGQVVGAAGAAFAVWAVVAGSLPLFLLGMLLLGAAKASVDLGRYVAGEVHPPDFRARAIAMVVLGATIGAVVGPLLVAPMGSAANAIGLSETAGPYLATIGLLMLTMLVLLFGLRPEPGELAREVASRFPDVGRSQEAGNVMSAFRNPAAWLASLTLVVAQMVMVMVMVITSLHMRGSGHPLSAISLVISSHTFGMYAFSVVSGQLTDRIGRHWVILLGLILLGASSGLAGLSNQVLPLGLTLFGLGLGWNLCYVAGSTLLSDHLAAANRARVQGVTDTLVASASAVGSLGSGVVFAAVGYGTMGIVGAIFSLIPFLLIIRHMRSDRLQSSEAVSN
ncbi:MAG: MFS transporter [Anaerolineales bacterium]